MKPRTTRPAADPLVGKYGLTWQEASDEDNVGQVQFRILARTTDGRYLIQLFDWDTGAAAHQELVEEAWFVAHCATFYDTIDVWRQTAADADAYAAPDPDAAWRGLLARWWASDGPRTVTVQELWWAL